MLRVKVTWYLKCDKCGKSWDPDFAHQDGAKPDDSPWPDGWQLYKWHGTTDKWEWGPEAKKLREILELQTIGSGALCPKCSKTHRMEHEQVIKL